MNLRRKTLVNLGHGRASRLILFSLAGLAAALALVLAPAPTAEAACGDSHFQEICYGGDPYFGQKSTIELAPGAVYSVDGVDNQSEDESPNGLPQITANVTINGHGAHIARSGGAPAARLIDVEVGILTLNEVSLEYGHAGPGIYLYNNLFASSDASVPLCQLAVSSPIITQAGNLATGSSCPG